MSRNKVQCAECGRDCWGERCRDCYRRRTSRRSVLMSRNKVQCAECGRDCRGKRCRDCYRRRTQPAALPVDIDDATAVNRWLMEMHVSELHRLSEADRLSVDALDRMRRSIQALQDEYRGMTPSGEANEVILQVEAKLRAVSERYGYS